MATTKRATKKALAEFCETNNLSVDKVLEFVKALYPSKFTLNEELANVIIKALFKQFDTITDSDIKAIIKQLVEANKLSNYDIALLEEFKKEDKLRTILEKVIEDVKLGDVRLSQYPEYDADLLDFIKQHYGHWSVYDDNGKFALGKAFYCFFSYWYFDHQVPPFHCYADGKKDVLFTKDRHSWSQSSQTYDFQKSSSSNSGCLSTIVLFIAVIIYLCL